MMSSNLVNQSESESRMVCEAQAYHIKINGSLDVTDRQAFVISNAM